MITVYGDLIQGSEEWHAARLGLLTASEMHLIVTPTLKQASNDKERQHLYELLAQRVNQYVEPSYISDATLRGHDDEILARELYSEKYAPVREVGFITNDDFGFTIGYSPDGLVGEDGQIEAKSRVQKYQAQVIIEDEVPKEHIIQIQTGLIVTRRKWCDYISYCGGMPMWVKRVYSDDVTQKAIIEAATAFEDRMAEKLKTYNLAAGQFPATERREYEDILV